MMLCNLDLLYMHDQTGVGLAPIPETLLDQFWTILGTPNPKIWC